MMMYFGRSGILPFTRQPARRMMAALKRPSNGLMMGVSNMVKGNSPQDKTLNSHRSLAGKSVVKYVHVQNIPALRSLSH